MECESKEARIQLAVNAFKKGKQLKQLLWPLMSLSQLLEEEYMEHLHVLKKQQIAKIYQKPETPHFHHGF